MGLESNRYVGKYLEYVQFRDSNEKDWAEGQPSRQEAKTQSSVQFNRTQGLENLPSMASWSEAQMTAWTCDWCLKWDWRG